MKKVILGYLLLSSCASSHPSLLSVTSQNWIGGRQETGSGTNYSINLIVPESSDYFLIQKICVENRELSFNSFPKTYQKGDTISLNGRKTTSQCTTLSVGVIHYKSENFNDSLSISNIHKLPQLFYP